MNEIVLLWQLGFFENLKKKNNMDELTRQTSMAWSRGFQLGLILGIGAAIIWSLIVVVIILILL